MKIGDRCFVHGYIDEIRKDTVIIRNNGGYFGTIPCEVITGELPSVQPRNGKWEDPKREGCQTWDKKEYAQCSECGAKEYIGWGKNFCPNCGADMRGEQNDKRNDYT